MTLSRASDWILVVVGTLLESLSLAQTGSDPGMRLRGDLPKPRARLLDWCANPPGERRECGRPPMRRVSVLCSAPSSSRYRGGSAPSSSRYRGANPSSCRYRGASSGFDFLLESLPWFKPGERLSLANGWMCQYPYGKNTGVSRGTNRGESNVS